MSAVDEADKHMILVPYRLELEIAINLSNFLGITGHDSTVTLSGTHCAWEHKY